MKTSTLSVAGFRIRLRAEEKALISLEESFLPFVLPDKYSSVDVMVNSISGIPHELLLPSELLFEAKNDDQRFFSIHCHGLAYKFIVYDQQAAGEIQQVAILSKDLCEWEIYSRQTDPDGKVFPLLYPMGPLVFYYLTLKAEAVMLHASGIADSKKGRLFTGFSGSGKSTMAYLWQKEGADIINDDRLIIRKEKDSYVMYNTPMPYVDIPKKAPLDSIYLIKHARKNSLQKVGGASAVSRLLAFCIQHNYNSSHIEHNLAFISELCENLPVYETGFLPNTTIVDLIKKNEN